MSHATDFDPDLIQRYDRNGPRYTSYPTAAQFLPFTADDHRQAATRANAAHPEAPLSVYVHVPFCASPCFYCGCNRVISRDPGRPARYLSRLLREIDLQAALFQGRRVIEQLHFGGGTPTHFSDDQLATVIAALRSRFGFVRSARREFSIEIDPRTVDGGRLATLRELGFNRLSLGVQDVDPEVQAAINRVQSTEHLRALMAVARDIGFQSLSMDLIYGLPRQTPERFARTLDLVVATAPDRVALYGYAHLPAQFRAQRMIQASALPDAEARLALLQFAVRRLTDAGYVHIGMDHFARPDDGLAQAVRARRLQRNFQGYSTRAGLDLLGLGVSAISRMGDAYSQNARRLRDYEALIDVGQLPTERGRRLSAEDRLRATVIEHLMCGRTVHLDRLAEQFGIDPRQHFASALAALASAERDQLVRLRPQRIDVMPRGRYLLRALAMPFDAYLAPAGATGSRVV
jgi:oxygen-independent coproporphyrinogen III oxidase